MDALTDEQLEAIVSKRRQELVKKRQLQEDLAKSEKRLKLLKELDEINGELTEPVPSETSSSTEMSSSSELLASNASSSASSASAVELPPPLAIAQPKLKNSMFAYWDVKTTLEVELEAINAQRIRDAKANSESRESAHHNERKLPAAKKPAAKNSVRTCSSSNWTSIRKKLKGYDAEGVKYDVAEKRIWCSACICFVRDDYLLEHVATPKHLKASKAAEESSVQQASLETAISISTGLSGIVANRTHLFRCEFVRTLLTSAIAINKADELRFFLEKWTKIESTDSSNLLRDYLPVIKVPNLKTSSLILVFTMINITFVV